MTAEKTLNRFVHDRRPGWFPKLPTGWKGNINLGLNYNETNTTNKRFYGDFGVEGDVGRSNWKGSTYFAFARANRIRNEDDWGASARWRFRLLETGFVETLATHDIDEVAEPARRSTGSIGFGFKPLNRETLVFDYVLGGAAESIENRNGIVNEGFRISLNENLRWKLNSHMTLRQSFRILVEPDSSMNYNYRFESGLDTLIIGALNLSVLYRVDYDTTIQVRENRQKTRIVTTIGVKF
jgi:putative salt-induced outer membrane protein YdiY